MLPSTIPDDCPPMANITCKQMYQAALQTTEYLRITHTGHAVPEIPVIKC